MTITSAVVTGAASGIGHALAARLAAAGTRLVLADVHAAALGQVAAELHATAIPTDVADQMAMQELAAAAPDANLVCLNAGIVGTTLGAPWQADPSEWNTLLAVNLGGVVNGLRAFVPRLLASGQPGHILITASLAGLATFPGGGAYAATKHAVVAVAEQTALALADTPVGVTMLCPALVARPCRRPASTLPTSPTKRCTPSRRGGSPWSRQHGEPRSYSVPSTWSAANRPHHPHPHDRRHAVAVPAGPARRGGHDQVGEPSARSGSGTRTARRTVSC
jgi:NADP-dependent 3-hydroxy acid dehydrogenase YdfG